MLARKTLHKASGAVPAFLSIQLESLRLDKILSFDLYINVGKEMVLYRSRLLEFNDETRRKLMENSIHQLFISQDAREDYQQYIEETLTEIISDPKIEENKKALIIYDSSRALIKDVLSNPTYSNNIRRSQNMVENTIEFILRGRQAFLSLMKITSFDYYTYTHSVNVCTFALSLARQIGITDRESLAQLGTGALLHDVGKSKVSERILNKKNALNRAEFEIMKKHPMWGAEILKETNIIPSESYYPVLQHHERIDGSGYPNNMMVKDQHIYGKIVAICDVFDALTTQRVYQDALGTFSALKIMHSMSNSLDPALLHEFTMLMGPDTIKNFY